MTTVTATFSQELRLVVYDKPLNVVLNSLNVEISFNDKVLSSYRVSVSKTFGTPGEAISYLLKDKPFKVEKIRNVFVISHVVNTENKPEPVAEKKYILSCGLTDRSMGEPLPYVHVQTGKGVTVTCESGMFTLVQTANQPVRIQAQYLGFERLDTVFEYRETSLIAVAP